MANNAAIPVSAKGDFYGEVSRHWLWLLGLGVLFIVLGVIGLWMTLALTIVSILVYGVFLLIGGGLQLVHAFTSRGWRSLLQHVAIALLFLIAGTLCIVNPLAASVALTLLIAVSLIAIGLMHIVMAFRARGTRGWGWLLFTGIIGVVIGVEIAIQWPVSGLWAIGLFVAIEMLAHGWSYIMIALAAREQRSAA